MINYSFHKLLSGVRMIVIFAISYNYNNFILANNSNSQIGVTIINSYSGSIAWWPSANVISSGGYYWSSGTQTFINVTASTWSLYTLYGWTAILTGVGTWSYTNTELILLWSGDYSTSFQAEFLRDFEPYSSNILELKVDRTAPSIPIILSPINNTVVSSSSPLTIEWTNSIDSGIGTLGYWIHLSLHPSFIGESLLWVTNTWTQIPPNSIPAWTVYWYIEAVDILWNSSQSSAWFFHYSAPTIVVNTGGGGGNWGGGVLIIPDNCPSWDFSPSYYDNTCGSAPTTTGTNTGIVTQQCSLVSSLPLWISCSTWDNNTIVDTIPIEWNQSWVIVPIQSTVLKNNLIQWNQKAQSIKPITIKKTSIYRNYNNTNTIINSYIYKSLLNTYWKWNHLIWLDYNMVYLSRIIVVCIQVSMRINSILHFIVRYYNNYKQNP